MGWRLLSRVSISFAIISFLFCILLRLVFLAVAFEDVCVCAVGTLPLCPSSFVYRLGVESGPDRGRVLNVHSSPKSGLTRTTPAWGHWKTAWK